MKAEHRANKDHFAKTNGANKNQKCARNVKRTSEMVLLLIELVESFVILDVLINCEFPLTLELRFDCFSFHSLLIRNCGYDCHSSLYSFLTSSS